MCWTETGAPDESEFDQFVSLFRVSSRSRRLCSSWSTVYYCYLIFFTLALNYLIIMLSWTEAIFFTIF